VIGKSSAYTSETYGGVEIRVRASENSQDDSWSGRYSFFTGSLRGGHNERICGETVERFPTESDAINAALAAGKQAVDQEVRVMAMMVTTRASHN
jgi:hypothetical protein